MRQVATFSLAGPSRVRVGATYYSCRVIPFGFGLVERQSYLLSVLLVTFRSTDFSFLRENPADWWRSVDLLRCR